jgi:TonB family protein
LNKTAYRALVFGAGVAALSLAGAPPAFSQTAVEPTLALAPAEPDSLPLHAAEALRYDDALARGDQKAAELHAYGAWRAAESELGDHRLTAQFAVGYGREVVLTDPALALGPLQRARALSEAGYPLPSKPLLALYLAYAKYATAAGERDIRPLRDALYAADGDPGKRAADDIVMWMEVAKVDLDEQRYEEADYAASKVESAIVIFEPDNEARLAEALLVRGVSRIAPKKRSLDDALNAIEYFQNGERLFAPQQSFETFDPTLAGIVGWNTAANAVIRKMSDDPSVLARLKGRGAPLFQSAVDKPKNCGVEWDNRTAPKFPQNAVEKEEFGAVVAIFDLDAEGSVQNPRILAAAPSDAFNDSVLKAMRSWRLKAPSLDHPGCRRNMMTQFSFVVTE